MPKELFRAWMKDVMRSFANPRYKRKFLKYPKGARGFTRAPTNAEIQKLVDAMQDTHSQKDNTGGVWSIRAALQMKAFVED
ncbi:MAG: hypothetical protein D6750_10340 [Bacteroidetes bacterium]|nr:MAG: hypothetical protein D6750_10340 [Bacteroidota bacterium]